MHFESVWERVGGKDGVRGYEGVVRGGGGRGRWYSGGWRWWGCALRIYSRQHIHHGGFSWTRNALPWIYICFHPYPNFLPLPSFTPLPPHHNSDRILAGISCILTKPLFFNDSLTLSAIRGAKGYWIVYDAPSITFRNSTFYHCDVITYIYIYKTIDFNE